MMYEIKYKDGDEIKYAYFEEKFVISMVKNYMSKGLKVIGVNLIES